MLYATAHNQCLGIVEGFSAAEYLCNCILTTPSFLILMTQITLPFSQLSSVMFIKTSYKLFRVATCVEKCDNRGTSVLGSPERQLLRFTTAVQLRTTQLQSRNHRKRGFCASVTVLLRNPS